MSKQTINIGASPNDGTGTPLRTSFDYTNQNFTEIYTALGGGVALPGATTQVIFNDGGTNLAGDAGLVYNKTTDALTVAGLVTAGSATITGAATVGTTLGVTGVSTFAAGTALLPALTTTGDTNTGIYYPAADTFSVTTGGVERYRVDSTGLGIGVSPTHSLTVRSSASAMGMFYSTNVNGPYIIFQNSTGNFGDIGSELGITGGGSAGNLALNSRSTSNLCFAVNDSVKMRIDSSGNVGIGVTPSAWISGSPVVQFKYNSSIWSNNDNSIQVNQNAFYDGDWKYINAASLEATNYFQLAGKHIWRSAVAGTAGNVITWTTPMTLDASGNLLVGTPSAVASGSTFQNLGISRQVLTLKGDDATSYTLGIWSATTTGDNFFAYFGTEASLTVRGGISYNRGGGLVAYNTTSDYRAKDIIGPVSNSGSLIDSLKVYVGKMKGATIERPMLIAHEAQEVAPYAVTGTKDEVDAEGKPKYQQMDASALVPLLIAEIQSLRARVQTLEAR